MSTVTAPARLVLPHDADRDEWLAARRQGVTASEIAVILGISPFDSPFNLYYKKTGQISEDFDNTAMSLGRHLEPWIADRWAEGHPAWYVFHGGLWANTDRPWQLSTTDRDLWHPPTLPVQRPGGAISAITGEPLIPESILEIKSSGTYDGWGEDGTDEIPAYYRAQVLWQLDTLDLREAHVSCLFLGNRQIRNYLIKYDVADVDLMRCEAHAFLERVEHREPPPIDGHKATTSALKALHPTLDEDAEADVSAELAARYSEACAFYRRAETHKKQAENELRAAMGDAKYALHNGQKVATRSVYDQSGMDTKRLRAEHPDVYADCRTTTTIDKLVAPRAKKEAP